MPGAASAAFGFFKRDHGPTHMWIATTFLACLGVVRFYLGAR
jgi:hypothetical protein